MQLSVPIAISLLIVANRSSQCSAFLTPNYSCTRKAVALPRIRRHNTRFASQNKRIEPNDSTTVVSQAALIAGTTIGGGFLALPAATAPCGAVPASIGLLCVWIFLLCAALSLSDAIFIVKRQDVSSIDDVSLFSLVKHCFGSTFGGLVGLLFLLLIKVTLIAQLSKIGVLLQSAVPMISRHMWTSIFSGILITLCILSSKRRIEGINDVLTATMLISFASLVMLAGGSGWSSNGLMRSNFSSLLPSVSQTDQIPWAIPTFIQLLIYNEVVPIVASRLNDERKVRKAIVFGSLVPLAMCLIWNCVALGIVPYEPSMVASGMIYDPLTKLNDVVRTKEGGKIFLASVNILAGSAICTTAIGSILAITQFLDGLFTKNGIGFKRQSADESNNEKSAVYTSSLLQKVITHTAALVPSTTIAILGSSQLYYQATSFAGEFPCTLLYGLIPPLCNMRLRWLYKNENDEIQSKGKKFALQILLAVTSCIILLSSIIF